MTEEAGEPEEVIFRTLLPDKRAEKERRKKIMPLLIDEYLQPNAPVDIEYFVRKYDIPQSSIYYYFNQEGVSRKDVKEEKKTVLKEVRAAETTALSNEAEKIATIAIGLGGVIARRYLDFLDYEMSHGKTIEFIAEDIMQWFEMKHSTLAEIDELKTKIVQKDKELSAAWAMNLPNFKYWLRTKILERYATQVINARVMGVRLPVSSTMKAMQTDLLKLEGDVDELFKGETIVGIES
jgi:hypothetical protein